MTKYDLLDYLAGAAGTDATEVASAFAMEYSAAAMALLRLSRQGLVRRYVDADRCSYFYELTERGQERLAFFRQSGQ